MEVGQLRYFVAVAEAGSFTQAAARCFVSQPSLSQQIGKLEEQLAQPLFHRGRGVRLTDAGRVLYDRAVEILASLEDVRQRITEGRDAESGRVSVGVISTVAPYLLPRLISAFAQRHPQADITVHENFTEATFSGCLTGELDVGIVALPLANEHLDVEPLMSEELLLAAAPDHPLARKRRVTLRDLDDQPFVLLDEAHCLGEQIVAFCRGETCRPVVTCRTAQLLTVQKLAAIGRGVSLIPQMAADCDSSGELVYRSLSGRKPLRTLAMVRHNRRFQSPLVKSFCQLVREDAATTRRPPRRR
jgi:LysR family hydrogen peroxide-inducible transcriptional activator